MRNNESDGPDVSTTNVTITPTPARAATDAPLPGVVARSFSWFTPSQRAFSTALRASLTCDCDECDAEREVRL